MKSSTRQELISYYKWVVSLSVFVITAVIYLVSSTSNLIFSDMLNWGVALLLFSIFFNWLAIKRLTTESVIESEGIETKLTQLFRGGKRLTAVYGLIQNWFFVIGFLLIILSFTMGENITSGRSLPNLF